MISSSRRSRCGCPKTDIEVLDAPRRLLRISAACPSKAFSTDNPEDGILLLQDERGMIEMDETAYSPSVIDHA